MNRMRRRKMEVDQLLSEEEMRRRGKEDPN